ncbi:non-ribosomal peptide synthetase [Pectobacterium odoriferum]|uniref:non-ribosomal peptide synthetase n=1 Tax=Pectobacterium odoriferum TaxID=78398 RepID=UPI001CA51815|nr:non-ribosomal peptide synthetase [Pectobacterium odoriferum]
MLAEAERRQVLVEFNQTRADSPDEACLHALFEAQAARDQDAVALCCDGQTLRYGELNARANQLAHWLYELGVRPDSRVALVLERGVDLIVAMLATLKAGGAYVPLDPGVPPERLRYMLDDSDPTVVLTSRALRGQLGALPAGLRTIELDGDSRPWTQCPAVNSSPAQLGLTQNHLAYVIYTSGSSGQPKGVMVTHRGVVNLVRWHCDAFVLRESHCASSVAGLGFDAAVWEIWPPLCVGARLVMPSPAESRDPDRLLAWWMSQPIDVGFLPTPVAELVFARELHHPTLRTLLVGGDRLNRRPPDNAGFTLVNNYGPTENSVVATSGAVCADDQVLHIGRPIANTALYILDPQGEPVPVGVCGELYIGGAQVARGYLNRPELSAERFLDDPFAGEPGARLYRTGDLGRWLTDGRVEFMGRNDSQVKIRGFRIELGEIESALLACDGVCESVVVAQGDATQEKRLIAYYTVHDTTQIPGAEALKAQLDARLPAYMVPAAYVRLARIPLTANGKVDRKALPEPDDTAFVRQRYEAPLAGDETALAAIWQALLGVETVGRQDDFFALGGHSLLAVQLISRIRSELNCELPLAELFARPALKDMAASLGTAGKGALSAIEPLAAGETPPLSLAQQRLWFLAQMDEAAGAAYVIAGGFRLRGKLDVAALRQALDRIVARHAALRTHIESREGAPVQVVEPAGCGFPLRLLDAGGVGTPAPFAPVFDLTRGPLALGELVRISDDEHWLRLGLHHVIADGWSVGVSMRELGTLYQAFSAGGPDPLPPLEIQYGDYAAWQHRHLQADVLQAQQRYWVEQLRGIPACLTLPTDRPRPPVQSYAGAHIEARLDSELTDRLKTLSRRHGCTLFMTLLAGWSLLMSRLSGQDEVVIGTPVAGRGRREIESLIGMFVNTQALRVDLSASPDTGALLAQVKTASLAAQSHADIPFEQVVEAVAPARSLSYSPLFQVLLVLQNTPDKTLALPGLTLSPLPNEMTTAQFDLSLDLCETDEEIKGTLFYATALFDEVTVRRYLGYWQALLRGMTDNADQPVRSLPILPEAERRQVLIDFNQTSADYPSTACIHSLFEARAKANPDALALIDGDRRLSYGELNRRADRLARWLAECGVRRESRVAIALERGVDLIVAILSTLKAGGAYVPLDPSYPQERLHFIVADSTPQVLITDTPSHAAFSILPAELIVLDVDIVRPWDEADSDADEMPMSAAVNASTLAYIMYTSGSTGRPKGVMVQHGSVVKLALNNGYADFRADDRIACLANPAFDASTMELWGALLNGGSIAIFSRDTVLDARLFGAQLREQRVSILFMTTALFNQYAHALQDYLPSLRYLLVGGESLDLGFIRHTLRHGAPQNFMHVYGPTETTTFATAYRMNETDPDSPCMPIGRPIANTVVYLLDGHKQPVPIGVTGEVYIGGSGVARGYLNLPEQTAERFLSDPFAVEVGARMYRTGDLARWRVDGTLEFQGRNDFQVKIRGFRIELGEIESALQACNGVTQAVVAARNSGADKQLVAYYTADDGVEICAGELKAQLGARLPAYMVPAAYVKLETIPLTANGKVDHKALPTPDEYALARGDYEAPQGREEQILAVIWQNLLGVEQVSRHDDFFALGGHSLLAVRFINEARKQEIYLTLSSLFAAPQLRLLAEKIQRGDAQNVHDRAVAFRASGSQRPLFIVPEASAEMLYGPLLASCIDSDIPVYGLMGPDRNLPTFKTLEGAAARYVGIIRSTQPQGPYRLLGWSFGGTLAYEIAAQLLGQDQQIEFLGMLDTRLPERDDGHIVPMDELFALSDDEAMIDFLIRGDIEAIVGADCLERSGRPVNWREHYQLGQKMGMLPAGWSPDYYQNWIHHRLDLLRVKYHVPTLPVNLDLFIAQDEPNDGGQYLGWDRVLPCEAIRLFSLHGEHRMLVSEPYVRETGKMVSEAIQARSQGRIAVPDARDDGHEPIVPLQTGERNSPTLLCVHGAGDNVFAFIDLVKSVVSDWTVLGLQARGLWGDDVPHSSVESAAEHYFQALRRQTLSSPLYLLGHSFGGWVALELATKLEAEGIAVASLVLADSDAPTGDAREYTDLQTLVELVELFEMQGCRLGLDAASLDGMTHSQRLVALHRSLIAQGLMPENTRLSVVEGIFRVFSTNIRTRYAPSRLPAVTPYLILACDADNEQLQGWQALFPQLRYARSEGNHTQLLKSPCSALLVEALLQK